MYSCGVQASTRTSSLCFLSRHHLVRKPGHRPQAAPSLYRSITKTRLLSRRIDSSSSLDHLILPLYSSTPTASTADIETGMRSSCLCRPSPLQVCTSAWATCELEAPTALLNVACKLIQHAIRSGTRARLLSRTGHTTSRPHSRSIVRRLIFK